MKFNFFDKGPYQSWQFRRFYKLYWLYGDFKYWVWCLVDKWTNGQRKGWKRKKLK